MDPRRMTVREIIGEMFFVAALNHVDNELRECKKDVNELSRTLRIFAKRLMAAVKRAEKKGGKL